MAPSERRELLSKNKKKQRKGRGKREPKIRYFRKGGTSGKT